jgi:hypothetical protein
MRVVRTKTGGSPVCQAFVAGEALVAGDVVVLKNSDNKVYRADGTILVTAGTNDRIDVSDLTIAGEGVLAGLSMGKAATGDTVVVALACNENIFEANYNSTVDGTTAVANVLDVTDVGQPVAIVLLDTGYFMISDNESTEGVGYVLEAGYGFAGESVGAGHGIMGDTNARVRFYFSDALIRTGTGLLLYGG